MRYIYIDWVVIYEAFNELIHNGLFIVLVVLALLDFITGTIKAITTKDLSSSTGINGLLKHTTVMLVVTVVSLILMIGGLIELKYIIIIFYVFEYVVSILENLNKIGIPFPERVEKILRQWQDDNKKGGR